MKYLSESSSSASDKHPKNVATMLLRESSGVRFQGIRDSQRYQLHLTHSETQLINATSVVCPHNIGRDIKFPTNPFKGLPVGSRQYRRRFQWNRFSQNILSETPNFTLSPRQPGKGIMQSAVLKTHNQKENGRITGRTIYMEIPEKGLLNVYENRARHLYTWVWYTDHGVESFLSRAKSALQIPDKARAEAFLEEGEPPRIEGNLCAVETNQYYPDACRFLRVDSETYTICWHHKSVDKTPDHIIAIEAHDNDFSQLQLLYELTTPGVYGRILKEKMDEISKLID